MHRKYGLIFFSLLIASGIFNFVFAFDAEAQMQKANELYQKNNYSEAAEVYQALVDSGYKGTALYYNLGNSYYKLKKLGFAILNYERALKLSPGDEDIEHNLALANTKTIDRIDTLPRFFIFQWWEILLALFSLTGWTYLAFIFYLLILFSIAGYFLFRDPDLQRYSFFSGIISGIVFVIIAILFIVNFNREMNIRNGVIVEPAVITKVSPDQDSNDAFVIHEGLKVIVEDEIDNWVKIKLQDGKIGWMNQNNLRII